MSSLPTPNFILNEEITYPITEYDYGTLPQGTFVRPIDKAYVPEHVLKDKRWGYFTEDTHVFCYTPKGFILIRKESLRKV